MGAFLCSLAVFTVIYDKFRTGKQTKISRNEEGMIMMTALVDQEREKKDVDVHGHEQQSPNLSVSGMQLLIGKRKDRLGGR